MELSNVYICLLCCTDQWSPINLEGKKQYGRDFLLLLATDPLSMAKPDKLPIMEIIKDKAIAKISPVNPGVKGLPGDMFTPSFVKSTPSRVRLRNSFIVIV